MAVVCVDDHNVTAKKREIKQRGAKFNYTLKPVDLSGKTAIFYTKKTKRTVSRRSKR